MTTQKKKIPAPPPDYSSRSVQLRLLLLVGMFMLVVILATEASKPQNWQWMWGEQQGEQQQAEQVEPDPSLDTRLPAQPAPDPDAPDAIRIEPGIEDDLDLEGEEEGDALERARRQSWSRVWNALEPAEHKQLARALKAARDGTALEEEHRAAWPEALDQVDQAWQDYLEQAHEAVALDTGNLSDEEKVLWLHVLHQLEVGWRDARAALQRLVDDPPLDEQQRQVLDLVQQVLDQRALQAVRDNSTLRTAEQHAWFRLLEMLDKTDEATLRQRSMGPVGFLQLFQQPKEYRGQLVTVRGTARLAYRVQAPKNVYGIDGYYIFWIKPAGGPSSPIVVYALETPADFPEIKDRDVDGETTALNEDVEFTGYFFKRWVYQAQDGLNLAPLVLAKTPRWQQPVVPGRETPRPSPALLVLGVLATAAVAVGLAALAYWQSKNVVPTRRSVPSDQAARIDALQDAEVGPGVDQSLQELAEQEEGSGGDDKGTRGQGDAGQGD